MPAKAGIQKRGTPGWMVPPPSHALAAPGELCEGCPLTGARWSLLRERVVGSPGQISVRGDHQEGAVAVQA